MDGERQTRSPKRLNALTSLRFLAAAVVVAHHSVGTYGIFTDVTWRVPVGHAVSFFFVLSGFVLTYVYESLDDRRSIGRFLLARFARIWPLHVATLFLVIVLLSGYFKGLAGGSFTGIFLSPILWMNAFLVHAWIPAREYFWSYNSVSWTVSTELGLYLCFPVLLYNWKRTWHVKLFFSFLLCVGIIACCNYLDLPPGCSGGVGYLGLIGISPMGRLFEFAFGMTMALAYGKIKNRYDPGKIWGTIAETAAFGMVIGSVVALPYLLRVFSWTGECGQWWIGNGQMACLFTGPLILVVALEWGLISKFLSMSFFVSLGEMSFALYLLHQIVIRCYRWKMDISQITSSWLIYMCLIAVVLIGSHLLLVLVERPCRRFIVGMGRERTGGSAGQIWIAVEFVLLIFLLICSKRSYAGGLMAERKLLKKSRFAPKT